MELTSVRSGGPFTDHPACSPATLASLCRRVNDGVGGSARQELTRFLPDLLDGPRHDPRVAPALVLACVGYAEELTASPRLARHRRVAARQLSRAARGGGPGRWGSLRLGVYRRIRAERGLACARRTAGRHGDAAMLGLLDAAVQAYRLLATSRGHGSDTDAGPVGPPAGARAVVTAQMS